MRLNKKILSIIIVIVLSCTSVIASASGIDDIMPDTQNAIVVKGVIEEGRPGASLIFKLTRGDEIIVAGNTDSKFDDNKNVVFEFEKIFLPVGLESGEYTVTVFGEGIITPMTTAFSHNGPDRKLKVLKKIAEATTVGEVITSETDGETNAEILGIDISVYNKFDDYGKIAFETIMKTAEYDLPADYKTDAEIAKIKAAMEEFSKKYDEAIPSGQFAAVKTATDFTAWYDAYYAKLGFDSETKITTILNDVKGTEDFIKRIADKTEPLTKEQIQNYLYESALISGICTKRDTEVKNIILDFPEYFPIDRTEFDKLNAVDQSEVIEIVGNGTYESCSDVADEVDRQVLLVMGEDDDDNNGGDSGRKYKVSGTGSIASGNTDATDNEADETAKPIFKDINEAAWAENAIAFLYEYGIVNGNPDGTFAPNNNVTRAEFVKMLTLIAGITGSNEKSVFEDVSADSWYAPYVVAAYKLNIVKGDENGYFYPEANITRQDMVTMMYRAFGEAEGESGELSFTDKDAISDYAADAIGYFSRMGVVNGYEDGSFGPNYNATRAEAATVLYNLITSVE